MVAPMVVVPDPDPLNGSPLDLSPDALALDPDPSSFHLRRVFEEMPSCKEDPTGSIC